MVAGAFMKCVKYLMFFFNLLFLLAGLAMVIIGAVAQASTSHLRGLYGVNAGAIFIIVIGGVIFIVAFFGCCGAIKENRCLLITFGVCMSIILVLSIAAVITAYVYRSRTDSWLSTLMRDQLVHYREKGNVASDIFWNNTQRDEKCCGVTSFVDWKQSPVLNETHSVPDSCCVTFTDGCGFRFFDGPQKNTTVYTKGCFEDLKEGFKYSMLIVGGIAIAVAILQVIGIILAFSLAHAIHKGYNVV
jgi:CD63 antigen